MLDVASLHLLAVVLVAPATTTGNLDPLRGLRPGHPRLLVDAGRIEALREGVRHDEPLRGHWSKLVAEADRLVNAGPLRRELRGRRMLHVSREAFRRITLLSLRWQVERHRPSADRAVAELLAVCSFADWNPAHFLDTAEMTAAVAIGYDWLHDAMDPRQRDRVRDAILEKGLKPGLLAYDRREWWTGVDNNWAQVTAGGLTLGALAIADDDPELARRVLRITLEKIRPPMHTFAPDGGHVEGPGYWTYATRYNVLFLAAMETALGHDFGLASMPGFDRTGDYRLHTISPAGLAYNYADGSETIAPAPQMHWLARRFNRPDFASHELDVTRSMDPLALTWLDVARLRHPATRPTTRPLDACFRRAGVVAMRSAWDDREALYVGFKGGNNAANHAHLDLGSFVLDALGERFIVDPGTDSYNLPRFWGDNRWAYFRYRTEGHSTVLINDQSQRRDAVAPVVAFRSSPELAIAVIDLTDAWRGEVTSLRRGIAMVDRNAVLVRDEMMADKPVEMAVLLQVTAEVRIAEDGRSAVLSRNGRSLVARLDGDNDAKLDAERIELSPPQRPTPGHWRLVARWPGAVTRASLTIVFSRDGRQPGLASATLRQWIDLANAEGRP